MANRFIQKLLKTFELLRFSAFDVSTEKGRSRERRRRAAWTSITGFAAKSMTLATQLLTIPLVLRYLGAERFGLWITISSLITTFAFADLGIGNGLLNAVAAAHGRADRQEIRRAVSSAAMILTSICFLILICICIVYPRVSWGRVFNVRDPLALAEVGPAVATFIVCLAINVPATIVQRVQLGLQMGYRANIWQAVGSALGLLSVVSLVRAGVGLPYLVGAFSGAPIVAAVINAVTFFSSHKDIRPGLDGVVAEKMFTIMRTGLMFLVLQLVVAVTYASDNLVIARILGPSAVTTYAIPEKMFSVIPAAMSIILLPLWPAYGEAIAQRDLGWIRRMLYETLAIALVISVFLSLVFLAFGGSILHFWVGHDVAPALTLMAGFAVWKIIEAVSNVAAIYLNASGVIREQLVISVVTAAVTLGLKIVFVAKFGVVAAIWTTVLVYATFSVFPYYRLVTRSLGVRA